MDEDLLAAYDYELPPARIAQHPTAARDASRLLLLAGRRGVQHYGFVDLPGLLQPGDLLVRNDTRVIPARLRGHRAGGGKMELLLVHRVAGVANERWLCLARPASHLKPGKVVTFGNGKLQATVEARHGSGKVEVCFHVGQGTFAECLADLGETPLPPYIERQAGGPRAEDRERYQTLYAKSDGAVAAPTAGLHFTPAVDAVLEARGIEIVHVTLHVGPGTFRPIITERASAHTMDAEYYEVTGDAAASINSARQAGRRIIAVGTTSTRTLETVTTEAGETRAGTGWTKLFIRPGYRFRAVEGLLTNFHLPRSSLLLLVSALAGRERILGAYQEAIREGYRFYSYGDAMLILP